MWASPKPPCLALPHPLPTSPCATTRHADRLAADIGQFIQGMLSGGSVPDANLIRDAQRMRGSPGSYDYSSPTNDNSPAVEASAASEGQAASDDENQAIQQMNDTNALTASMAAAEQQTKRRTSQPCKRRSTPACDGAGDVC